MERFLFLIVGFVLGFAVGLTNEGSAAPAKPKQDYADVRCRGNGDEGYRKCRIDFDRPARKVAVDIYIGGEYDMGMVWEPGKSWKRVTR